MEYFYGTPGTDNLVGSDTQPDGFVFYASADLTNDDVVSGGSGDGDVLYLNGGGTYAALAGVTGIEEIDFGRDSGVGTSLVLSDSNVGSAFGKRVVVVSDSEHDHVDASGLSSGNGINYNVGSDYETVIGGDGNDNFLFGEVTSNDVIVGGGGTDFLRTYYGGDAAYWSGLHISGIELLTVLGNGHIQVVLNNALVSSALNHHINVRTAYNAYVLVDASVLSSANSVDATIDSSHSTFLGGGGNDTLQTIDVTAGDVFHGNGGYDTLHLEETQDAADLVNVTGFESFYLIAASMTIDDQVAANNASVVAVVGVSSAVSGTGNDTFDASAVTLANRIYVVTAGDGNDTLRGGAGADKFRFAMADLDAGDIVNGEGGSDALVFTTAGTIGTAQLAGVSGVERIVLANGANSVSVDDALMTGVLNAKLLVTGGSGNDAIDGSQLTGGNAIDVTAGGGADTLRGGAGADVFRFATTALTAADIVAGGAGTDTLVLTGPAAVGPDVLAGLSGVEQIQLATGQIRLTLDDAVVSANGGAMTVIGSNGNDIADASALGAANGVTFIANGGNDTLTGGAGDDRFRIAASQLTAADHISGGGGNDILTFTAAGAADLSHVTGIGRFVLANGANTLTLRAGNFGGGIAAITVTGNGGADTIDGSAATGALTLDGGLGDDILTGGAGADRFQFTTTLGDANIDSIAGFTAGQDMFALGHNVFAGLSAGALDAGAFVTGTAAADADDRIIYDPASGALSFDSDGAGGGAAVRFATLATGLTLSAADFRVV